MTDLSREILENWQVRHTKKQKAEFIAFLKERLPALSVEKGGVFGGKNLVLGDVSSAKVVFGAHYDTCAALPFPNIVFPKSVPLSILYGFVPAIPLCLLMGLLTYLVGRFTDSFWLTELAIFLPLLLFIWMIYIGVANQHTANDNTSGVVTLLELYASLSDEERETAAFVLFDNEELGLFGSAAFYTAHKKDMKEKLLINADCVSDGDELWLLVGKKVPEEQKEALREAFSGVTTKTVTVRPSQGSFYPSDQASFPVSVGAAAFKKGFLGLYLDRIHTSRDTVFDEENIRVFVSGFEKFVRAL